MLGLLLLLLQLADLTLGSAVILHQGDVGGADVGAGAALDAVEQVMGLELLMLLAEGKEVQLLRQQADRAGLGAISAADAGQCGRRWRQFFERARQQAVGGLDHRHFEGRQAEAHHRTAHDQPIEPVRFQSGKGQQFIHRGADQHLDVHRLCQRLAGQGGDARDQRFAEEHGVVDGDAGSDVLAEHADIRRQATTGHLFAGENLDQLLFTAGRILGREDLQGEGALTDGSAHRGDRFGLVVLDADQYFLRLDQVREDLDSRDQLGRLFTHQQVVGGDVGLALGAIDDQRADRLGRRGAELHCGGKAGAAEAADARLANQFEQGGALELTVIRPRLQLDPFVLAIAVYDDCVGEHA